MIREQYILSFNFFDSIKIIQIDFQIPCFTSFGGQIMKILSGTAPQSAARKNIRKELGEGLHSKVKIQE